MTAEREGADVEAVLEGFGLCNCWTFTARAQDSRPEHIHSATCTLTRAAEALAALIAAREGEAWADGYNAAVTNGKHLRAELAPETRDVTA